MKQTKSILDELSNFVPTEQNKHTIIETKATHLIASAINLINLIKENYNPAVAEELHKRLISSIKFQDDRKFKLGIKKLKEGNE